MSINKFYFRCGLPYRDLITQSEKITKFAKRDLAFLQEMGVVAQFIEALEAKTQVLREKSTFDSDVADKKLVTTARNLVAEEVKDLIEKLRKQLRLIFNKHTSNHDAIFTTKLTGIKVGELVNIAEKTLEVLNKFSEEIAIYGVTAEVIASFEALVVKFASLHSQQVQLTSSLNNSTFERSEMIKDLFLSLEHISVIGKAYWKKIDPAKMGDYVIIRKKKASDTSADADGVF